MSQPCRAQRREVDKGRLAAREEHEVGIAGRASPGSSDDEVDVGLGRQRVEIVEVGDPRQAGHGDASAPPARRRRARPGPAHPPWAGRARPRTRGRRPADAAGARARSAAMAAGEQRGIAAELVDEEAARAGAIVRVEHRHGADELAMTPPRSMSPTSTTGTPAARAKPMLAMSPARRLTSAGLPAPSTRTRSASPARRRKLSSTAAAGRLGALVVARAVSAAEHPALHDDLRAGLALRLQQHRVHVDATARTRRRGPAAPAPGRSRRHRP